MIRTTLLLSLIALPTQAANTESEYRDLLCGGKGWQMETRLANGTRAVARRRSEDMARRTADQGHPEQDARDRMRDVSLDEFRGILPFPRREPSQSGEVLSMTRASEFTKKVRGLAFARCKGKCEKCGAALKVGEGEYDHVIPLALTGESTLENCQVLCRPCHRDPGAKTAEDVKRISKAKRSEAAHTGVTKPAGNITSPGFPKTAKPKPASKWDFLPKLEPKQLFTAKERT